MQYGTITSLIIQQFNTTHPDAENLNDEERDGVRLIMNLIKERQGFDAVFSFFPNSQLSRAITYIDMLKEHRQKIGRVRIFGVFGTDYRSQWFTDRKEANDAFLAEAKKSVEGDTFTSGRDISLSPSMVDISDLHEYFDEKTVASFKPNEVTPLTYPTDDSGEEDAPVLWELFTEEERGEISEQIEYIKRRTNNTTGEERARFEALLNGHNAVVNFLKSHSINDDVIRLYLDELTEDQIPNAQRCARESLKVKTSRGMMTLYVVKDDCKNYYIKKEDAMQDYLASAAKLAKAASGSLYLE
ncbi:MAG: hypothetical protein VYD08_03725, partial [Pseudomonadota bacterium]|nr:hypothetical protein [Pseudomonadota bacterium]